MYVVVYHDGTEPDLKRMPLRPRLKNLPTGSHSKKRYRGPHLEVSLVPHLKNMQLHHLKKMLWGPHLKKMHRGPPWVRGAGSYFFGLLQTLAPHRCHCRQTNA